MDSQTPKGLSAEWPPEGAELICAFTVLGEPKPAGSIQPGVVTKKLKNGKRVPVIKNGRVILTQRDSSGKEGLIWRSAVAEQALIAYSQALGDEPHELIEAPLVLEAVFYRKRNKGHYGTGRNAKVLKDSAPSHPITKPDVLKLTRAVEDAISGMIWTDDSRVVDGRHAKRFGTPERAEIRIWRLHARAEDSRPEQPTLGRIE